MVTAVVVADAGEILFQQVLQFQEFLFRGSVPMVARAQPVQLFIVAKGRGQGLLQVFQEQLQVQHRLAAVDAQQLAVMADMLGMAGRAGQPDVVTVPGKADGQCVRVFIRLHSGQETETHHVQGVTQQLPVVVLFQVQEQVIGQQAGTLVHVVEPLPVRIIPVLLQEDDIVRVQRFLILQGGEFRSLATGAE